MPNVLLIGNYPPPHGGVPGHIEGLAAWLVRRGWDVHVLSGGRTGIRRRQGLTVYKPPALVRLASGVKFAVSGPNLREIKESLFDFPGGWRTFWSRVGVATGIAAREPIDVIGAYNLGVAGPVGLVVSRRLRIPLVVSNFGEILEQLPAFRCRVTGVRTICEQSSVLVSCSRHCAGSYRLLGLAPQVEVVPYGVDLNHFHPIQGAKAEEVRWKLGIPPTGQVVTFVGRLVEEMGVDVLLAAVPLLMAKNPGLHVVICGASGRMIGACQEAATHYPGRVLVVPDVPYHSLPMYYQTADVVVVPTRGDRACSSLAGLEAMACGKPVIGSRVGGIPEVIANGESGVLVSPGDPATLASTIEEVMHDPVALSLMGQRARVRAKALFDVDETHRRMEEIFLRAIDRRTRERSPRRDESPPGTLPR